MAKTLMSRCLDSDTDEVEVHRDRKTMEAPQRRPTPAGDDPPTSGGRVGILVPPLVAVLVLATPLVTSATFDKTLGQLAGVAVLTMLAFLVVLTLPHSLTSLRSPFVAASWLAWMLVLAMAAGLLIHSPTSTTGALLTFVAAGGAALASSIGTMGWDRFRRYVAVPLLITATIQSVVVALQALSNRALVLEWVETGAELETIDGVLRPQGTMDFVFEPALLALVALGVCPAFIPQAGKARAVWLGALALVSTTIGFTYSRSAMLGVLLLVGALWITGRRGAPWAKQAAAVIAGGVAVAVVLSFSGWLARIDHTTTGSLDDASLGRITLAATALEIIRDHPLGVGTHRYLEVLDDGYLEEGEPGLRVHNFSLLIAAELGVVASLLLTTLLITVAVQAIRAGPWQAGVFLVLAPFLVFDVLYYDRSVGILIFMVWLGALAAAHRRGQPTSLVNTSS